MESISAAFTWSLLFPPRDNEAEVESGTHMSFPVLEIDPVVFSTPLRFRVLAQRETAAAQMS